MNDFPTVGGATALHSSRVRQDTTHTQASTDGVTEDQSGATVEQPTPVATRTMRTIDIDPETQSVVFRVISETSGSVVAQYPAEVQLRLRAYLANSDAATKPTNPAHHPIVKKI